MAKREEPLDLVADAAQRGRFAVGPAKQHQNLATAVGDYAVSTKKDTKRRGKFAAGDARRVVEHDLLRKNDRGRNVRVTEVHVVGDND